MGIKKHYVWICFEGEELYIELDAQEYAIRQLNIEEHSVRHLSFREGCLAEGVISETDIQGEFQHIYQNVKAKVIAYDEENMWLVLE